jgi:hypothetical protein
MAATGGLTKPVLSSIMEPQSKGQFVRCPIVAAANAKASLELPKADLAWARYWLSAFCFETRSCWDHQYSGSSLARDPNPEARSHRKRKEAIQMAYDKIPIVVVLYELEGFRGQRKMIVEDCREGISFWADVNTPIRPRSIGIHPGPDYKPAEKYEVSFYAERYYKGAQLVLGPGAYPDLNHPYNFGGMIESIKFGQGIASAPRVSPIPLAVEIYNGTNFYGESILILDDVPDLDTYPLAEPLHRSVKVHKGPNYEDYDPPRKARLFKGKNYSGEVIELAIGDYPNMPKPPFGYEVGSIRVR